MGTKGFECKMEEEKEEEENWGNIKKKRKEKRIEQNKISIIFNRKRKIK